jgi:hypothetical protein
MRVLVTVSPRLYREAIALSIQRGRLDLEVRAAPPEDAQLELAGFRPHLLVHNDNDGLDQRLLSGVPCWVKVLYSDSMDARIGVKGNVSQVSDISMDDLSRVLSEAQELISEA